MANNRIYLRCNECGKVLFLGKSMLKGYYYVNYDQIRDPSAPSLERKLNTFYVEHAYCGSAINDGNFSIEYEFPIYENEEEVTK